MKSHSNLLSLGFVLLFVLLTTPPLHAITDRATVAVVDSGTDFEHELLSGHELTNKNEIPGNRIDDDRNSKVDDLVGWNFVDRYNRVFYREHLDSYSPVAYRLLEIIGNKQAGKEKSGDQAYWDKHIAQLGEEQRTLLINHLNSFGQYLHGTHVAGIVAQQSGTLNILSARVFADEPPPEYSAPADFTLRAKKDKKDKDKKGGGWTNLVYRLLAALNSGVFDQVAVYLNEREIDVANYSLGVPLQAIARALLAAKGIKDPTPQQLSEETKRAYAKYESYGKKWMAKSPNTLFVIAAGNDGSNNDLLPTFPANIDAANSITVAATRDNMELADFSCYGATTVHVAAPGVAIEASVPSKDNRTVLPMSGTSMAAPIVSGVAGRMKELNPRLTPADMKSILMGTVDKKAWLRSKVISEGVVNAERAYYAARSAASMTVAAAIAQARANVPDAQPLLKVMRTMSHPARHDNGLSEAARHLVF
ncbi:MAG: S8 family serine peptidase [Bdellovibrionaceae bacterium]|nr:S8 family serine peptidase [Pseudobdellovibrionaceae bacterium]